MDSQEVKADFRDRKVIKKLEFTIRQVTSASIESMPFVLYEGRDYSRMNEAIHTNIGVDDVIIMPLEMPYDYCPFIVVCSDYRSGWDKLCETLQKNMFAIAATLRQRKKKLLNVDAFARSINRFRVELEKEVKVELPEFVFVTQGDKK